MKYLLIPTGVLLSFSAGVVAALFFTPDRECGLQEARLDLGDAIGASLYETRSTKPFRDPVVQLRSEDGAVSLAPWTQKLEGTVEL